MADRYALFESAIDESLSFCRGHTCRFSALPQSRPVWPHEYNDSERRSQQVAAGLHAEYLEVTPGCRRHPDTAILASKRLYTPDVPAS